MASVETTLGRLHVQVRGIGPAVLFWPSLLMDGSLWAPQVAHLSPTHTTVAVDPPGHGRSQPITRTFTLEECATVVVEVLDALGIDRAYVVGNSWGAMTGGTVTARHPDRVLGAVLLNGTASAAPRRQRLEYAGLVGLARLLGGIRGPLLAPVRDAFLGPTSVRTRPDVVRTVLEVAARNDVRSASYAVRSVVGLRPDQRALFGTIERPVLVVAGREDATFPLPELETMAAAIPGSELVVLEDAAHLAALEVPDRVNELLIDFLRRHPPT